MAALAIPLLALQAWWSVHDYRSARARAETDALAVADVTALGVTQFFSVAEELLTATVSEFGDGWNDPAACAGHMTTVTRLFPFLANAVAVDGDGDIVCSVVAAPAGASAVTWPWWEEMQRRPAFMIGDPVEGDFTGTRVLPLVAPVTTPDGAFAGAIVGSVPLTQLSRLFGGIRLPPDHLVTVATAERVIIARSHDAAERVGQPLPPLTGTDRLVSPGRWVATGPDLAGILRTWGQVEISGGWIVYVGVPDTVVYGPALREALGHVASTLLVVFLGIGLAAWWYGGIASALRELARRTGAAEAGQVVPPPEGTPAEVNAVLEQFNRTLRGRDRAEAAERRARERFQSLFDNAVFGLYVSTEDGRFLQVNPALVEMLGYPSEETLLEAGPRALYPDPGMRDRIIAHALETGAPTTEELEWLRYDGVPITVRVGGKLIEGPGGEPVFEMIVQDITREKRTEDELRQTQKMEAIGQLAGGVAHDFNNLLTVIGGNVELLEDEIEESDPLRRDLAQIGRATKRATSLTRRLLAFSRKQRRDSQVVDVNELIPEFAKMLVPLIGEAVTLRQELDEGSLWISIDPGELEQAIMNLVLNARDAMPYGGEVVIRTRRESRPPGSGSEARDSGTGGSDVGVPEHGGVEPDAVDGVSLSVSDSGVGMDPEVIPRIFEPFYTTKPMGSGTGLGLSTVYGIVKRSGGTLDVDSARGVGTTLTIWFPSAPPGVDEEVDRGPASAATGSERVLVVEDDELVRTFVRRALEEAGYSVVEAPDAPTALDLMGDPRVEVDLVLTDVVMPGMNGPELAERLALTRPATPVLFMSGYVDSPYLSEALDRDPDRLLRKPFSAGELRSRVRRALDGELAGPTSP